MLIPRRVKHRKQHHPGRSGAAKGGTTLAFGDYGIQALTPAYVTNRQIESARIAMTRYIKRGGKVWIYKGDVSGTRTERAAQKAARAAAAGARRPARGPRRDGAGPRGDRPERGGRRRAEAAADAAPAAEASETAGA